jgi:hypothetical protein
MRASAPDSEVNRARIELEMSNNRQGVTLTPGLSRPPSSCDAGRNGAKTPSLLFLLYLRTVISDILIMLEPERTRGENFDQRGHDNGEIRFKFGPHGFANVCPC